MPVSKPLRETIEVPPVGARDPRETADLPVARTGGPMNSRFPSLHDDPHKIHQLLDLLVLPPGTEVRVTTVASSLIVR